MIGQTLAHYRIVEKIGAGGMGEVYRATDTRLEREVALKVLPSGTLADEAARKRFRKEALTLSKLNHPHIATVHDFDTQHGIDFLVMEYVAGGTLAAKLKSGPLPEKEVARLSLQIVEALEEAREQGIVHRDMKPGNVMVTPKGQVKVLDFGLAKLTRPEVAPGLSRGAATTESFTETQGVAGTLPYMAPEQLRDSVADHRSDIYSFGAVLYEMATGQRPFQERLATALVDDIIHKPPPLPGRLKPDLSPRLEEIILKCLEKEPERRYQSAKELAVDLRRLSVPTVAAFTPSPQPAPHFPAGAPAWGKPVWRLAAAGFAVVALLAVLVGLNVAGLRERLLGRVAQGQITSLAVLPLENMMGDAEQDYFVEGMHEALITELSKIGALKVISRTSAMRYKDSDKSVPEIARELGVDALIEGSVLRAGSTVRVTAQLIEAATDRHLWAESYERDLRDILALQSEVARAIAREIKVRLTLEEEDLLATKHVINPEAHLTYLKGRHHFWKATCEGRRKSIEFFQEALNLDPAYAPSHAGMADAYNMLAAFGCLEPKEAYPLAKVAARRALELDNTLAEAHTSLASIRENYDWDWVGAEREYQRAIELNPGYATAHTWYASFLSNMGRHEQAIAEIRRAQALDPLSLAVNTFLGGILINARQYDQAIEQLQETLEIDPAFGWPHVELGITYVQKVMYEEAIAEYQRSVSLSGGSARAMAWLGYTYAVAGRRREAQETLKELKELSKRRYVSPFEIAMVYTGLGEEVQAFEWLEKAYEERDPNMVWLKNVAWLDPLRSDPRFHSLLRRMNFPGD